jgi:hypothetical protein
LDFGASKIISASSLKSFSIYFTGKGGAVITEIRKKYDVNIQLPKRGGDEDDGTITITGVEDQAKGARDEILSIVNAIVRAGIKYMLQFLIACAACICICIPVPRYSHVLQRQKYKFTILMMFLDQNLTPFRMLHLVFL